MKQLFLALLALCFLLTACPDDDELPTTVDDALAVNIVTGLNAVDSNGAPVGTFENPNTFAGEVAVFPNPATTVAIVQYTGQATGNAAIIDRCWIFTASRDTTFASFNFTLGLNSETYTMQNLDTLSGVANITLGVGTATLNLSNFTAGYYRIFYQMGNGERFWDNLYIDPTATDPNALWNVVAGDW